MTRLLIDAGNSCLKWTLSGGSRLDTDAVRRHCYTELALEPLLEGLKSEWSDVTEVWVSSVLDPRRRVFMERWFGLQGWGVHFVSTEAECCGVKCAYEDFQRLGVDRWLALLAANKEVAGDKLVVDLGTAITLDLLGFDGRHHGGVIAPGLRTMLDALTRSTALDGLELVVEPGQNPVWATDTEAGIQMGLRLMVEGAIHAAVDRARVELGAGSGQTLTLILTGGHSGLVMDWFRQSTIPRLHRPDLVLSGLDLRSRL